MKLKPVLVFKGIFFEMEYTVGNICAFVLKTIG